MTEASISIPTDTATTDITERRMPWATSPLSFLLGAFGVLALLIGLVTPWVDVTVGDVEGATELQAAIDLAIEEEYGSANPVGITLDDGALVVVLAAAFVILLGLHFKRGRQGKGLPIAAFVVAMLLALIGIGNIGDVSDTNEAVQLVLPVTLEAAVGLYITIVGGLLAMASAAVAVAKAEPKPQTSVA